MPKIYNALQLKAGAKSDYNRMGSITQPVQFLLTKDKDETWGAWNMDWYEMQGLKQIRRNARRLLKNYKLANGIIDKSDYIVEEDNEMADLIDTLTKEDESAFELKFFPIMMFAVVMGFSGLTITYQKAAIWLGFPHMIGDLLMYFTTSIFAVVSIIYVTKFSKYSSAVKNEFSHPIRINFFAAVSISMLMLSIIYKESFLPLSAIFWYLGTILHFYLTMHTISFWINKEALIDGKFEWQDEYFAVSVSESMIDKVRDYIKDQENHHSHKSWQDEYNELIDKYGFQRFKETSK